MRGILSHAGAKGAAAALLVSLAGAGFSAHAGLAVAPVVPSPSPKAAVVGYEADDHFPGSAALYADGLPRESGSSLAAPSAGATGTIVLPAAPVAQPIGVEPGVLGAAPFLPAGTRADRARALQCLTTAIYYEAAVEPDAGQAAVAQVILNRVRHPAFPPSVCGVVFQGSEHAGCQFSFACDGAMARVPQRAAWERARRSAARALAGYVYTPVGLATHYHTFAVAPAWSRTLVMTDAVGAHFFHRWKGWWGTAAAFRQDYRGGEPLPGPHAPVITPTILPVQPPPFAAPALLPVGQALTADGGSAILRDASSPVTGQILDRWKDSGQPLR